MMEAVKSMAPREVEVSAELKSVGPVHVRVEACGVGELGHARQLDGRHDEARVKRQNLLTPLRHNF